MNLGSIEMGGGEKKEERLGRGEVESKGKADFGRG
jgi:hypothetical protein